ncbi:hypothetical protein M0R45_030103 [Rubus argutus]|uniref:Beta-glucosidase n=1 Tax=Rubus argutus TaxID=59490 RepID=A0AAW1WDQ1_RUBAR
MALTLSFSLPTLATTKPVSSFKRLPSRIPTVKIVGVFPSKRIHHKRVIRIRPCSSVTREVADTTIVTRDEFPTDFKFGCATSALQTEGSGTEGGRGPSTWDYKIQDDKTEGIDIATDSYNRYTEDVQLLKNMGVDTYRFSLSWSRVLPDGTIDGGINQEGIDFYNKFIDELIANGITPFVTLFHFDLPTALDTKYNGFLSTNIVEDFKAYADLCFKTFGDRVKYWATINEPQVWGQYGFTQPSNANAITDPLISTHNVILAHATAAKLYKETYQPSQGGEIGIPIVFQWFEPFNYGSLQDVVAGSRAFDFMTGWFLEPLVYGDYPFVMRALLRDNLPEFTDEQKELVKGSYDYIGVNYYTSYYAEAIPISNNDVYTSLPQYMHANVTFVGPDGEPIGPQTPGMEYMYVYPEGLRKALVLLKNYENPKIYVTENGYPDKRDDTLSIEEASTDDDRIKHMQDHLAAIRDVMKTGTNVKGYLMWALLDCMEMGSPYHVRFGLNYTDYLNNLNRSPKKSAGWLKDWLAASTST